MAGRGQQRGRARVGHGESNQLPRVGLTIGFPIGNRDRRRRVRARPAPGAALARKERQGASGMLLQRQNQERVTKALLDPRQLLGSRQGSELWPRPRAEGLDGGGINDGGHLHYHAFHGGRQQGQSRVLSLRPAQADHHQCLMRPSDEPDGQPSAQQGFDDHGPTSAAGTPSSTVDTADTEPSVNERRVLFERAQKWNDKFEDMCILGRRMQDELEALMPAAYDRVDEAAAELAEHIDQCGRAGNDLAHAGLASERSSACADLHGRMRDLVELRDHIELVAMAASVFPIGTPRRPSPDVTTRGGLVRLFEGYGVRLPAILKDAHVLEQAGA
ncbi:hypothetical protein LA080_013152 [Diaporthe eres]|nr:hypothetical protein LA080_013152 [Diaporthe eres]